MCKYGIKTKHTSVIYGKLYALRGIVLRTQAVFCPDTTQGIRLSIYHSQYVLLLSIHVGGGSRQGSHVGAVEHLHFPI